VTLHCVHWMNAGFWHSSQRSFTPFGFDNGLILMLLITEFCYAVLTFPGYYGEGHGHKPASHFLII